MRKAILRHMRMYPSRDFVSIGIRPSTGLQELRPSTDWSYREYKTGAYVPSEVYNLLISGLT
nr:hypothetical protein Q903MT_gene2580 [Picea sitchensis]